MIVKVTDAPGFEMFYGRIIPGLEHDPRDGRGVVVVVACDDDGALHVVPKRCVERFIGPRAGERRYGDAVSDQVYNWSRLIGGVAYNFSHIRWADGSVAVQAWRRYGRVPVHTWSSVPE